MLKNISEIAFSDPLDYIYYRFLQTSLSHLAGMFFVVKEQVTFNPALIGLFGSVEVMFKADYLTHYI
jgi:hypothetical protein